MEVGGWLKMWWMMLLVFNEHVHDLEQVGLRKQRGTWVGYMGLSEDDGNCDD